MVASADRKTVLVAGLGMVGIAFIEKLLGLDEEKRYNIITCGEEAHLAYNRVALTEYFQHRSVDKLYLNSPEWYAEQDPERFQFHTGELVTSINPEERTAKTSQGRTIPYDICVLATGSIAALPPYVTPEQEKTIKGVFVYRNLADLDKLLAYSKIEGVKGGKAVVIGGGLLGLEAAKAVYDLEEIPDVAIINRSRFPLSRQIDDDAGELVFNKIEDMGVKVYTNASVKEILTTTRKATDGDGEEEVFTGLGFSDGTVLEAQMVILAIGITPRDDLAFSQVEGETKALLRTFKDKRGGGIVVDDSLMTSAKDVYAVGECACWRGHTYGLIGPGVEMADILAFNLTQTKTELGSFTPRKMNDPDLSTKLKLMGVDVASFGDYFADLRVKAKLEAEAKARRDRADEEARQAAAATKDGDGKEADGEKVAAANAKEEESEAAPGTDATMEGGIGGEGLRVLGSTVQRKPGKVEKYYEGRVDQPIKSVTYKDPFGSVYKKYIFSADGKHLLGGIMIGDVGDYVKLVSIVKKKKPLSVPPSEFIIGAAKSGEGDGGDLDDDAVVCSCHAVTKGGIAKAVKGGCTAMPDLKKSTKAGTGCGGCVPLVTNIFQAELKKAGVAANTDLCPHFAMSRAELFNVVKIKKLKTLPEVMDQVSRMKGALGCETCKPVIGSILSSLYNEHVMKPIHNQLQDTNDKYMANIQRNGTFSVIPKMAAGEVTPDGLIAIGNVAKKYNLYTKITGGQRIDMFGAQKADLPSIWAELVEAGFQSGHAYGKSLRTVKSCVGTTWCRFGVGDSVGLAVQLEERYKSVRSPHKIKGGVSGCVRECAEAQSKDFGLIATDKGWNLFVAGNGGINPKHAVLFASDVPPSRVVRLIDRFLMFYIRTADKLQRTAPWAEKFEGGIPRLRQILIDDELGICEDLEKEMDALVGTYACEWTEVVKSPERQKAFRQFVNTDERKLGTEQITERGQQRPADWPKDFPGEKMSEIPMPTPREKWDWKPMAKVSDLTPSEEYTTSAAVKYGDSQLAIFHVPRKGYFATQQMCPHKRAFVLDHGLIGDDPSGHTYVSCPLHKRNFELSSGECLNDENYSIMTFPVKVEENSDALLIQLPSEEELDSAIGSSKWMVRGATAEAFGRGGGTQIEIVGPDGRIGEEHQHGATANGCSGTEAATAGANGESCGGGDRRLDW